MRQKKNALFGLRRRLTVSSSGKGDSPRNIFSKEFKKNYESINWKKSKPKKKIKTKAKD